MYGLEVPLSNEVWVTFQITHKLSIWSCFFWVIKQGSRVHEKSWNMKIGFPGLVLENRQMGGSHEKVMEFEISLKPEWFFHLYCHVP